MASKRALKRRSCLNKRKYETREAAAVAARMRKQGRGPLREYRCRYGGHYHVGHPKAPPSGVQRRLVRPRRAAA